MSRTLIIKRYHLHTGSPYRHKKGRWVEFTDAAQLWERLILAENRIGMLEVVNTLLDASLGETVYLSSAQAHNQAIAMNAEKRNKAFTAVAQAAVRQAENVGCNLMEFYAGLLLIKQEIEERIELAPEDGVNLQVVRDLFAVGDSEKEEPISEPGIFEAAQAQQEIPVLTENILGAEECDGEEREDPIGKLGESGIQGA